MFKFNFNDDDNVPQQEIDTKDGITEWYQSKEVKIPPDIVNLVKNIPRNQLAKVDYDCGGVYTCLSAKEVMNMLKEKSDNEQFLDVLKADEQHSDLLPGKYEGGLKTWECTKDLAFYFQKTEMAKTSDALKGKRILDLGCGSGILGIMCLLQGAHVTFQDYNQEVLEAMTIPNIFLNCDDLVQDRVKLYSGDWSSFLDIMVSCSNLDNNNDKYDYILTSETIYNPANYKKIIAIIKGLLKSDGSAFVAAKTHYFGVGGNLQEFNELLKKDGFISNLCWQTTEGVARGILKAQHQQDVNREKMT